MPLTVNDYFRRHFRYYPLDHINLVFRGLSDTSTLLVAVVGVLNKNWGKELQDHHYLIESDGTLRFERDWRTLGKLWRRYHIRFWLGDKEVLAAAHKDRIKKWPLNHEPESFEDAKVLLENTFRNAGWAVRHDSLDISAPIDDPPASGKASEIIHP